MKFRISVVQAADFIKSTPVGKLDLQTSVAALKRICSAADAREDYHVLIDLRQATSAMSLVDVWHLARELETCGDTFRRSTAILLRENGNSQQAEFFELTAQNRGFRVRLFTDFEQAVGWLGTTETVEEEIVAAPLPAYMEHRLEPPEA